MESFPHFDQFGYENQKGEGGKEKEKKKEGKKMDRERKKGGEKKKEIFSMFRRLNLHGPRVKVDPHNEGYAWVPKSRSFFKL